MRRLLLSVAAVVLVGQLGGCALFHELQPHRLHRLNRVPAPSMDPEFLSKHDDSAAPVIVRAQD